MKIREILGEWDTFSDWQVPKAIKGKGDKDDRKPEPDIASDDGVPTDDTDQIVEKLM